MDNQLKKLITCGNFTSKKTLLRNYSYGYRNRNTVTMGQDNKDFVLFYLGVFRRSHKLCLVFGVFRLDKSFQFRHLVIVEILIY